jgi:hypothetical protein
LGINVREQNPKDFTTKIKFSKDTLRLPERRLANKTLGVNNYYLTENSSVNRLKGETVQTWKIIGSEVTARLNGALRSLLSLLE